MKISKLSKKIRMHAYDFQSLLFGFLMLSSTMSYVTLGGIKIWYIALAISSVYLLMGNKIRMPHTIAFVFIILALVASLINILEFGFRRDFFNYILGIILICYAYTFVQRIGLKKMDDIMIKVAVLNACAVIVNTLTQFSAIKEYLVFDYLDHPVINTLSTGGTNIDASWLSIYCAAFYKSKYKWPFLIISIMINTLYAARVGYLINFFVICVFLYNDRKKLYKLIPSIMFLVVCCMPYISKKVAFSKAIARFSNVGSASDEGGIHRLIMWKDVPDVILSYPYGTGPGNTIAALDKVTGIIHRDGNLHNLLFEYFCSVGLIGGIIYVIMVVKFIKYFIRFRKKLDAITLMLAGYLIGGLVQFSGNESMLFLLIGGCLATIGIKKAEPYTDF